MKHLSKHAREVLAPGGHGRSFCSAIYFQMWHSALPSKNVSAHDEEEEAHLIRQSKWIKTKLIQSKGNLVVLH